MDHAYEESSGPWGMDCLYYIAFVHFYDWIQQAISSSTLTGESANSSVSPKKGRCHTGPGTRLNERPLIKNASTKNTSAPDTAGKTSIMARYVQIQIIFVYVYKIEYIDWGVHVR